MSEVARPRAYSYLRFSTPDQAKGDSRRRQNDLAVAYAAKHDLDLDDNLTFSDLGVSAFRGNNVRVGALADFLDAVRVGMVPKGSFLLVESLDRISRETIMEAVETFTAIMRSGVRLVTLMDGREYTYAGINQNPLELVMSLVVLMRGHDESATKSRRGREAWAAKRANAGSTPLSARGPAWLRLVNGRWEVLEDRAAIIRRIFERAAAGAGKGLIASELNGASVPTFGDSTRKPAEFWQATYVSKILDSPSVIGTFTPQTLEFRDGRKVKTPQAPVPDYYPSVVDLDLWNAVRGLRDGESLSPARGRHAKAEVRNLLGGLACCPRCGSTMTRKTGGASAKSGSPVLICTRAKARGDCVYRSVKVDVVESAIRSNIDVLAHEALDRASEIKIRVSITALEGEREVLRRRTERVVDAIADSDDPPEALTARLKSLTVEERGLTDRLAGLEAKLVQLSVPLLEQRSRAIMDAFAGPEIDIRAANTALRRLANRIVVDYVNGFLAFHWTSGSVTFLKVLELDGEFSTRPDPMIWTRPAAEIEIGIGIRVDHEGIHRSGSLHSMLRDSESDAEDIDRGLADYYSQLEASR